MLYIIRGLPGSGKTTLAKTISKALNCPHVEADQFFERPDGSYVFAPEKLKEAHRWCLDTVVMNLSQGRDVVVSNTFTRLWELKPYVDYCLEFNIPFTVIQTEGDFGSIHNIPDENIARMKGRWEPYDLHWII